MARGTSHERGYTSAGHRRFRRLVLRRDPICTICARGLSVHADHYPHSRRALIEMGADPNDPARGRGLCHACHSRETGRLQPSDWNPEQ